MNRGSIMFWFIPCRMKTPGMYGFQTSGAGILTFEGMTRISLRATGPAAVAAGAWVAAVAWVAPGACVAAGAAVGVADWQAVTNITSTAATDATFMSLLLFIFNSPLKNHRAFARFSRLKMVQNYLLISRSNHLPSADMPDKLVDSPVYRTLSETKN